MILKISLPVISLISYFGMNSVISIPIGFNPLSLSISNKISVEDSPPGATHPIPGANDGSTASMSNET